MNPFQLHKRFRKIGVLGLNARNAEYVLKYNRRALYPRADSKLLSKQILEDAGVQVPDLYHVVSFLGQFPTTLEALKHRHEFVIKPEHGCGGEGVLVISRDQNGDLLNSAGDAISAENFRMHLANILYGLYSIGGQPDRAMIEYRVRFSPIFEKITYRGVPDIRIIVFLGVPVMAMLRLPTKESSGRANLHQGAVGVGVRLTDGITSSGVQGSLLVNAHPDTGEQLSGLSVPFWDEILRFASNCYELFELGYLGVDIVLDEDRGPMILEVNARPGLAVQLANRDGLQRRLQLIEQKISALASLEDRIAFAKELET